MMDSDDILGKNFLLKENLIVKKKQKVFIISIR
jgi:hypothetical protein